MNWTVNDAGKATFSAFASAFDEKWYLGWETSDPRAGVVLCRSGESSWDELSPVFRLLPSEGHKFPPLDECYVRGNDLICRYPQIDGCLFGLDVCHRILPLCGSRLAIETICSVQTSLLDSHPTFDVESSLSSTSILSVVPDRNGRRTDFANPITLDLPTSTQPPPAITLLTLSDAHAAASGMIGISLMLPPSDRSVAMVIDGPDGDRPVRYRLLAEFMEKGVIRKARIWTVLWKHSPSEAELVDCYQQLGEEPLPLTP